jgi:hypothetical protein
MEDSMEAVVKEKKVKALPKEKKPRAGSNVVAAHPSYLLVSMGVFFLVRIACWVLVLLNLYCGFDGESCACRDGVSGF